MTDEKKQEETNEETNPKPGIVEVKTGEIVMGKPTLGEIKKDDK